MIEVTREANQPSARDHPDGPLQPFADGKPCTLIEHGTVTLP